jgi:hypothetical protein
MGEYDDDPPPEQDDLLKDGLGGRGGRGTPGDVFIRTASDIKRVLPSIFNLKVVSDAKEPHFTSLQKNLQYYVHGVWELPPDAALCRLCSYVGLYVTAVVDVVSFKHVE